MKISTVFLICLCLALSACQPELPQYDLVIKGAAILDGSGKDTLMNDLAIRADTIVLLGKLPSGTYQAKREIDGTGYILAPGFIDPHTHALSDLSNEEKKANLNYLYQGVTTVVVGNDGGSVIQIGDQLSEWEKNGIGTNVAIMVGHRTIRRRIMGMRDDPPTAEEMDNMKTLVAKGMNEGALGLSTGLFYAPASFAKTEEVIALAQVAAEMGGMYDAHIRDESSYNIGLLAAIEENIRIAKEANIAVNISHIKCLGVDVWGMSDQIIATIEAARKEGYRVTADQYPYRASGTHLDRALLPDWVFANDPDYKTKLDSATLLPRIKAGIQENMRKRGGAASFLIINAPTAEWNGKYLSELAEEWQLDTIETALKVIQNGSAAIASFNMQEQDIENFMQKDWVMTGSDGSTNHPRKYGTFPKKIKEYVLEKHLLSLAEMVRKSTSLTATTYQIPKRGSIKEGYFADLILFKPEEIIDKATFIDPNKLAEGMAFVIVNGKVVLDHGTYTELLPGRVIRK